MGGPGGRSGLVALGVLLAGCFDGENLPPELEEEALPDLCVTAECGEKYVFDIAIPDAENLLLTDDGRLFVSGGTNVFEIRPVTGGITADPLYEHACNFTGLARRDRVLYAACGSGELFAAVLNDAPRLQQIHTLEGMQLPNGMAVGPDDCLYVADGPLSGSPEVPEPQIVRVCLDDDPLRVSEQSQWLALDLQAPNGLAIVGRRMYLTLTDPINLNADVAVLDILPDGSPGRINSLHNRQSILDDLTVSGDRLLVTDYMRGTLILLGTDGDILGESEPGTFTSPSAVAVTQGPPFRPHELLVTEKGLIGEHMSAYGNNLSLYYPRPSENGTSE